MAPSVDTGMESKNLGRPLGHLETNWMRATATGTGVQIIGIALKTIVELKFISQAAREVQSQSAILRFQIMENHKGKLTYTPSERTPSVEELPWPSLEKKTMLNGILVLSGDDSENHQLSLAADSVVKQELNTPFRNASQKITGPVDVFRIHVYTEKELPSLGSLIILRFNSAALDRPSAINVAQSFLAALNAVVDGKVPQLPAAPGKNEILPALEDMIPRGKAVKSLIQKGIDTISYAMSAGKFSLFPFSSRYVESKHGYYAFKTDLLSYTLGKEGTSALLARSKQENTTYGAALSAAFLKGVADVKELKDKKLDKFSFTSLMDCRPYFEPAIAPLGLGNYTAGISQDEHVKSETSFWDLARSVSTSTEREMGKLRYFSELPVLNMLFSQILKRPNLTQKSTLRTALFSLFVDGPVDAQWKNVDKLELAGTFGPYASVHGIAPCFCLAEALIPGPELNISLVYPIPVYNKDQMESLAEASLQALTAAIFEL